LKKFITLFTIIMTIILIILLLSIPVRKRTSPRNVVEKAQASLPIQLAVAPAPPIVQQENPAGAVMNISIEMTHWVVCVDETKVYSNPGADPNWYLYSLARDTEVVVRELDLGTRTYAAIDVAHYVKFTDLCSAEE
jgi:hypothetical protein